ncbi:unnamed protein product [Schistosoma spindalis]|nr:unnamed protein product [Schistosoma spindale]
MDNANAKGSRRLNPFNCNTNEQQSLISALYDAPTLTNFRVKSSLEYLSSDYFSIPFVRINENSSVEELKDAILKCKHMFLALSNDSSGRKDRILDRLIQLRRILQDVKEFSDVSTKPSSCYFGSSPRFSELYLLSCSLSQVSLPCLPYRIMGPEGSRPSMHHTPFPGGHDFQSVSAIRHLGGTCEYCRLLIRGPAGKILRCRACGVMCHFDGCLNSLTRRCPGALLFPSTNTKHHMGCRRLRTESESGTHTNPKFHLTGVTLFDTRRRISFKHLEVSNLSFLSADLTLQSWTCAECLRSIDSTPSNTVLPGRLNTHNLGKTINEVIERGIGVLIGKAFEDILPKHNSMDYVSSHLSSKQLSLPTCLLKPISTGPAVVRSNQSTDNFKQYAAFASHSTSEPIQTWYDVCVMEAFRKVGRRVSSSLFIKTQNGQLAIDKQASELNVLENYAADTSCTMDSARLCYYSGYFYCSRCHWGDTYQIPAWMFVLGDYEPKPVCRTAYLWLNYAWSRHLFRVPVSWYYHEPLARQVCSIRTRIFRLQPYFNICSNAKLCSLDFEKYGLEWFLEQPYTFTMDLISQVLNGKLIVQLTNFLSKVNEHIEQCQVCETHIPSYCVVCNEGPTRPYHMKMAFCNRCNKSCHRSCLSVPLPISLKDTPFYVDVIRTYGLSELHFDWNEAEDEWIEVLYPSLCVLCKHCGLH